MIGENGRNQKTLTIVYCIHIWSTDTNRKHLIKTSTHIY